MSIPAQVKYIVLSLLFIFATVNFTRTTLSIINSSKRLDDLRGDVTALEDEKTALKRELTFKANDSFVEEEARNKLSLIKPGEDVFVMPLAIKNVPSNNVLSATNTSKEKSNSQLWIDLFF